MKSILRQDTEHVSAISNTCFNSIHHTLRIISVYTPIVLIKINIDTTFIDVVSNLLCHRFVIPLMAYKHTIPCAWKQLLI